MKFPIRELSPYFFWDFVLRGEKKWEGPDQWMLESANAYNYFFKDKKNKLQQY